MRRSILAAATLVACSNAEPRHVEAPPSPPPSEPAPGPVKNTAPAVAATTLSPDAALAAAPPIATEALIQSLLDGTVDPATLVDPASGVYYDDEDGKSKRHCGKAALAVVKKHLDAIAAMIRTRGTPIEIYCANDYLDQEDPSYRVRYASCSVTPDTGIEDESYFALFFVRDAERGLRVAGLEHTLTGLSHSPFDRIAPQLGKSCMK